MQAARTVKASVKRDAAPPLQRSVLVSARDRNRAGWPVRLVVDA
jgi:hypothetical protein